MPNIPTNSLQAQSSSIFEALTTSRAILFRLEEFTPTLLQPLMSQQKKDISAWQMPDTAIAHQFRQPPHFHKGFISSPDIVLTKRHYLASHSNRPSSTTGSTTSLPYNTSLAATIPTLKKPVAKPTQNKRFSSSSIATGPERLENLAKTLLARGSRKLKRQNNQADSSSLRTLEWLDGSEATMRKHRSQINLLPEGRQERMHSTGELSLRRHISQPYNFQHLTHTHANQFQTLQKTSHSELVSEFSAIRASQIPCRDLQGIKAESLQPRHLSHEAEMSGSSSPVNSIHTCTSPGTPRKLEHQRFNSTQASLRSVDHFSQPSPRSYKTRPSPIKPPPRISSKHSGSLLSPSHHEPLNSPSLTGQHSRGWSSAGLTSSATRFPSPRTPASWAEELSDYSTIPHAVSTPDETAFILIPAPSGNSEKDLPGLPEEPMISSWEKKSVPVSTLAALATAPKSGLRHVKSFPSIKSSSRRWSRTSPRVSPDGLISPLLDGPPLAEAVIPSVEQPLDDIPFRPRLSRQASGGLARFEQCWEADIDYCYEHAAEADCDFDWDRLSRKDEKTDVPAVKQVLKPKLSQSSLELHQEEFVNTGNDSSSNKPNRSRSPTDSPSFYLPKLRLSTQSNLSSRDSSKSSTLSINSPVTPSQPLISPLSTSSLLTSAKDANLGTSILIPRDFEPHIMHDELYQRLLSGDHLTGQVYPFHSSQFDVPSTKDNSPRSSHSQMSEKASQESFKIARSSSVFHQRDNESVGSLPELVFSRNGQTSATSTISTPRIPFDKPLPLRPRLGETRAQLIARQLMLQKSMASNPAPAIYEDPNLVTSAPKISPVYRRRKPSDVALRINANLYHLPEQMVSPGRFGPAEPMNRDQSSSPVFVSVPF